MLDVLPQRHLPRFLPVVVELAELLRIHPQLASHPDVGMRQVVAISRLDPRLHLPVHLHFFPGHPLPFSGGRSVRAGPLSMPSSPQYSLWGPQSPFPKSRTRADSLQALIRTSRFSTGDCSDPRHVLPVEGQDLPYLARFHDGGNVPVDEVDIVGVVDVERAADEIPVHDLDPRGGQDAANQRDDFPILEAVGRFEDPDDFGQDELRRHELDVPFCGPGENGCYPVCLFPVVVGQVAEEDVGIDEECLHPVSSRTRLATAALARRLSSGKSIFLRAGTAPRRSLRVLTGTRITRFPSSTNSTRSFVRMFSQSRMIFGMVTCPLLVTDDGMVLPPSLFLTLHVR